MNGKDLFCGLNHVSDKFIEEAESIQPVTSRRRIGSLFLVAALISILGVAAFAATLPTGSNNWFFSFFGQESILEAESELTDNQSAVLHAALVDINQSVTRQGYTITLESGLCDGYRALIKCSVEAPEGTSLNGRNYALGYDSHIQFSGGEPGNYSASSYECSLLEDANLEDHRITLLLDIVVQPSAGSDFSLADGSSWGFSFRSIEELTDSGQEVQWNTLCEDLWEFEVAFDDLLLVTDSVEMLTEPVRCLWTLYVRNREIPLKAKVFSFELRSMTATIRYKRPLIAIFQGVYLNKPISLILDDGTRVPVRVKMTTYREDYDETLCLFDRPVSPEDVAYIEFPGVGKVEVPQS